MRLLFKNSPFDSNWMYGRWEEGPTGVASYFLQGTLDGSIDDLREVLLREMAHET